MIRKLVRFVLPVLVVVLGVVLVRVMIATREPAATRSPEPFVPTVRVVPLEATEHRFVVTSEGTVTPRTEIGLVAEVSGRVTSVAAALAAGGFFHEGDVLATIESLDYEAALERARVTLRQAERRVAEENALADIARDEWGRIGDGEPTPSPCASRNSPKPGRWRVPPRRRSPRPTATWSAPGSAPRSPGGCARETSARANT